MANLMEAVRRAYDADQRDPKSAARLGDVPTRYELITLPWLTAILCPQVPGAEVTAFHLGERNDGSSNRRRITLEYNAAGQAAGLPGTVFCKAAETFGNRLILGPTGTAKAEVAFFAKVRSRLAIEAPVGLYGAYDEASFAYLVMMQDLTDHATFCDERTVVDRAHAEQMVRLLARLHATFHNSPELGTPTLPYQLWSDWWARMMETSPDFGTSCDRGFAAAERVIPARLFARRDQMWDRTIQSVERHRVLPRSLIHCDCHLRNWYVTNEGRAGLADWQIITYGHWSRDFIYAMATCLSVENRRAWLDDLLRLYLQEAESLGAPREPFEAARTNCRQQLFTSLAFWTITLRPAEGMPPMQPEGTTFTFLDRLATAMDDLDALDSF